MKQLIRVGTMMSHACHNLAQRDELDERTRASLKEMQKMWDEELGAFRTNVQAFTDVLATVKTMMEDV